MKSRLSCLPAERIMLGMALVVATSWVHAAEPPKDPPPESASRWGLGVGAASIAQPYRGIDNRTVVIPMVTYENRWIAMAGPGIDVKLPSAGSFQVRARLRYGFDGYDASDSHFLSGMEDRDDSLWIGLAALWRTPIANLSVEAATDALGKSDGTRAKAVVERRFSAGRVGVTPRVGVEWLDQNYTDYYYGVRDFEATAERATYRVDSAINQEVGVRLDFAIAKRQMLFLDAGYTRLDNEVSQSPIVGREHQTNLALGYIYRIGGP